MCIAEIYYFYFDSAILLINTLVHYFIVMFGALCLRAVIMECVHRYAILNYYLVHSSNAN